MTQHTPTPWQLAENDNTIVISQQLDSDGNAYAIADVLVGNGHKSDGTKEANAAFIVKACNAHEALVDAAKFAALYCEEDWDVGAGTGKEALKKLCEALKLAGAA